MCEPYGPGGLCCSWRCKEAAPRASSVAPFSPSPALIVYRIILRLGFRSMLASKAPCGESEHLDSAGQQCRSCRLSLTACSSSAFLSIRRKAQYASSRSVDQIALFAGLAATP